MRDLTYFNTIDDYTNGIIGFPNVSYVESDDDVLYITDEIVDICFYDNVEDNLNVVGGKDWNTATYPTNRYTPIGIVVVPTSHNVYGDGSCAVMSLVYMSCDDPQNGTATVQTPSMYWGINDVEISTLNNYTQVGYCGINNLPSPSIVGYTTNGYLPSDYFNILSNPYDSKTSYYAELTKNDINHYIPSPYNENNTRNEEYYKTDSPSTTANAMSDFDGINNTDKIIAERDKDGVKDYTTSNPSASNGLDYPAATCCRLFKTLGTNQGDWYLPSCGELGYMCVRRKDINYTFEKIVTVYGSSFARPLEDKYHWSSTEYGWKQARDISLLHGQVYPSYKQSFQYARAFYRLKLNDKKYRII